MNTRKSFLGGVLVALVLAATGAVAQDHGHDRGGPGPGPGPGPGFGPGRGHGQLEFDRRYHHDHYYPSRGYVTDVLPFGALSLSFGGGNYFYHGGVWYRPWGPRYVVVTPPLGIFAPVLPPDYVPLWIAGSPYYYADGVYYTRNPGQGYVVVAPPSGADMAQPVAPAAVPPAQPDPIFYPRTGQTADQTENDRRECNTWATTQPKAMADAGIFQRAVSACMDGRGYTVR